MKTPLLMALCLSLVSHAVHAAPPVIVPFANNDTVDVNLSFLDINRLVVKDDNITSVTCPTGFCTLPIGGDDEQAAPPIDPQGAMLVTLNVQEPFTLYVTTQKGRSFGAFVKPLAIPAVTTQFISTQRDAAQHSAAAAFEKNSPYEAMLVSLMKSMMLYPTTQSVPDGFVATALTPVKVKPLPLHPSLTLVPMTQIQGDTLTGVIYRIKNNTANRVTMKPTDFYTRAVRAVSLSATSIPPQGNVYLYQITQGGQ